jgi:hypothetical protein
MRVIARPASCGALGVLLAIFLGCSGEPKVEGPKGDKPKADPAPENRPPFGEKEGYLHRQSGVGFLYPDGWENLGVNVRGPVTSLGLRKGQGAVEVTLFWTASDVPISAETVGEVEWSALSSLYGDKLGRPEPVAVRGKPGYKLKIGGGPLGKDKPELVGLVYVFAVKSERGWWKIKLRATARDKEKLAEVEKRLDNYRW